MQASQCTEKENSKRSNKYLQSTQLKKAFFESGQDQFLNLPRDYSSHSQIKISSQKLPKSNFKAFAQALKNGHANLQKLKKTKSTASVEKRQTKQMILTKKIDGKSEVQIKKQFLKKLKEWNREKEEANRLRRQVEQRKIKNKIQEQQRRKIQEEQQTEFLRQEKKKKLEKKIKEIEERRQKRERSLKNAVVRRSNNQSVKKISKVLSYIELEQNFKQKQSEKDLLYHKLIKQKKLNGQIDSEQLRAHQKAYINRIKERLHMHLGKTGQRQILSEDRKVKSDINSYMEKKQEVQMIAKIKKSQQKIKIQGKINVQKQKNVLIAAGNIKTLQKYNSLSQRSLKDKQIHEKFKDFDINITKNSLEKDYLKQLKSLPKKALSSVSGTVFQKQSDSFLKLHDRFNPETIKRQQVAKTARVSNQRKIQIKKGQQLDYEKKKKQKDQNYMSVLKERLNKLK